MKNEVVTKRQPHNHAPDMSIGKAQIAVSEMKEIVKDARKSTSAVMNKHQEQLEKPYRPYLPSDSAMRRLQRSRKL